MAWIRYSRIIAMWRCISGRGYETKDHSVNVSIRDAYENRPKEDIGDWIDRIGQIVVSMMCKNSCQSLSTSVFCDETSKRFDVMYTSEVLVPPVKRPPPPPPPPGVVPVPKYILDQIAYMERMYQEAETVDEKMAIRDEINRIKSRYGIK